MVTGWYQILLGLINRHWDESQRTENCYILDLRRSNTMQEFSGQTRTHPSGLDTVPRCIPGNGEMTLQVDWSLLNSRQQLLGYPTRKHVPTLFALPITSLTLKDSRFLYEVKEMLPLTALTMCSVKWWPLINLHLSLPCGLLPSFAIKITITYTTVLACCDCEGSCFFPSSVSHKPHPSPLNFILRQSFGT